MAMGHKEKLKGGAEFDVVSKWRHYLCYLSRPGVVKSIKRQMNKRHRKNVKEILQNVKREENENLLCRHLL